MPEPDIDLDPADFLTIGTVGPKGQRVFYLQAASSNTLVSMIIEKEQARALSEAIAELLDDLATRFPGPASPPTPGNLDLREPIEPRFRVGQMGLGYDEDRDMIVLVAQSIPSRDAEAEEDSDDDLPFPFTESNDEPEEEEADTGAMVTRVWCTRAMLTALGQRASQMVASGRPDPRQNGRLINYWT